MENDKIRINISNTQYEVIQELAVELGFTIISDPNDLSSDIYWIDNALSPEQLSGLNPSQRINHFPGIYCISRKDHLGKNLKSMKGAFPDDYNYFPPTWVLPKDLADLKTQFNDKRAKTFICKPENQSQGKGIFLTRKLEEIPEHCVVQRYLYKPYLLDGFKFDLRVYVLIISCDPLRVYIHKEGLVRLATEPYITPTSSNLSDVCMHLTNYAINKTSSKFVFNQDTEKSFTGHKRSLTSFLSHLQSSGHNSSGLWADICEIIMKTLCVAQPLMSHLYRSSQPNDLTNSICFQILGFDIFLDSELTPYLLEVNHTPSFATETPLDLQVKKSVIGDALKMLGLERKNELNLKIMRNFRGVKELRQARWEMREKWTRGRKVVEDEMKGGYQRIYPQEGDEKYEEFMKAARDVWMTNLGIRRKSGEGSAQVIRQSPGIPKKGFVGTQKNFCSVKANEARGYSPCKATGKKLPALRLVSGSYLHPRIFDFNDYCQNYTREIEKQG